MKEVQDAIECWVTRPTWFSSHPSDVKHYRKAVSNLKKLDSLPSQEALSAMIYLTVKDKPTMLGTPDNLEQAANQFAAKILDKVS